MPTQTSLTYSQHPSEHSQIKMDALTAKKFERQCKMTQPNLAHKPPAVRIKTLIHTPNATDPFLIISADLHADHSQDQYVTSSDMKQFFKDPLCQFGQEDGEPKHTQTKLGHSMRASVGHSTKRQPMTQLDMMKSKQNLLEKMREQRETYNKRELAKEDATILVNQLLLHGYQITPPDDQPRFQCMTPMTTASHDFNPSSEHPEAEIVRSIHNELERVLASSNSPC